MKMQKINEINELKKGQAILILDKDGGVRGMDIIQTIDYNTGHYSYLNNKNKLYEGNLKTNIKKWNTFIVDEAIFIYNDRELDNQILSLEWVFENIYGDKIGSFIRGKMLQDVRKDFNKRIDLINLCKENEADIYKIRWEGDHEVGSPQEEVEQSKKHFIKELEKTSLLNWF